MQSFAISVGVAGLISTVSAHGAISKPAPRMPGDAMRAACGQQMTINQLSDHYGNIQGQLQVANGQADFDASACEVWLCKGYQFDDNKDNVQSYTPGQVVPIEIEIRAPHTGTANVSIVKTSTNSIIGQPLISFEDYASTAHTIPANQKSFDITIPSDLGNECASAGDCVIQWYWDARSIDQTYESCIDFTVSGSGSGSSPGSPTTPKPEQPSTSAPTPTAATTQPTSAASSSSTALPETFTVETFIDWLRATAGSGNARRHARQLL
ncbi:hypothetical protein DL766_002912 [Monosporascus sp. MC13-8B]|uniref:Chitin-binding type-4 domain-containing protein n=1 Tax=Monosporascus cannonballus TaxID=155416 RepID=A0ABY0H9J2_9PEZI|nr:hypothetical protein DL763_008193 [Monosporascus cannonballus]RYO87550.1 hypothetical protein DL762_004196 [Monosporascus cannonballus]RYP34545.1 hypothetical protein DL766_002912 [Monosporascus sp. MC13-8B]